MSAWIRFCVIIVIELVAHGFFYFLSPKTPRRLELVPVIKGLLERFVLTFGLSAGLPQVLIFFGAIKIGTRISDGTSEYSGLSLNKNDYYLIGNLISVGLSMFYYWLLYVGE